MDSIEHAPTDPAAPDRIWAYPEAEYGYDHVVLQTWDKYEIYHGGTQYIRAAIQPDPEPQPDHNAAAGKMVEPDPVAWRYRSIDKPTGWTNVTEERRTSYGRIGMEEQPLYATPSSAGTVSIEAAAQATLAEIERQFADVGVTPENMAPEMVLKRLPALAGDQP